MAKSKQRKRNPGGAAGMLIDAIERDPAKRETNLQELREQIDTQRYFGQTMHEIIYSEAYTYLTGETY